MLRQDLVDQRLIPDTSTLRFPSKLGQNLDVEANRDQLTCDLAERRPTDAPHGAELRSRRLGDVAEINLRRRTPRARGGWRAGR
ncbi:MAG: hypothetical protein ABI211_21965 [Vicinamibacterales bacterium]